MLFRYHPTCQIKHAGLTCHITNARWHTLYLQINSTGCIEKKLTYPLSKIIIRDVNFLSMHPVYCSNALTYSTAENISKYSAQSVLLKISTFAPLCPGIPAPVYCLHPLCPVLFLHLEPSTFFVQEQQEKISGESC